MLMSEVLGECLSVRLKALDAKSDLAFTLMFLTKGGDYPFLCIGRQ